MITIRRLREKVVDPRRRKDKDTPVFDRRHRSDSLSGSAAALQAMGLGDVPRRYLPCLFFSVLSNKTNGCVRWLLEWNAMERNRKCNANGME